MSGGIDATCPFLSDSKKCVIYEVRPEICRHFKCDHNLEAAIYSRNKMTDVYETVSMRQTFFKDNQCEILLQLGKKVLGK